MPSEGPDRRSGRADLDVTTHWCPVTMISLLQKYGNNSYKRRQKVSAVNVAQTYGSARPKASKFADVAAKIDEIEWNL